MRDRRSADRSSAEPEGQRGGPAQLAAAAAPTISKRLYLLTIAAARRTLDISSPYFITDESSDWSLEAGASSAASRSASSSRAI